MGGQLPGRFRLAHGQVQGTGGRNLISIVRGRKASAQLGLVFKALGATERSKPVQILQKASCCAKLKMTRHSSNERQETETKKERTQRSPKGVGAKDATRGKVSSKEAIALLARVFVDSWWAAGGQDENTERGSYSDGDVPK